MPLEFRILPRYDLLYVDCVGHITEAENRAVFARYVAHRDYRPGQRQLVDVARTTGYGESPADFMKLQARLAGALPAEPRELLMAYHAPTDVGMRMAYMAQKAWRGVPFTRVIASADEAEILSMLGLPATTIRDLLLCAG